jgi:hypothetical protein
LGSAVRLAAAPTEPTGPTSSQPAPTRAATERIASGRGGIIAKLVAGVRQSVVDGLGQALAFDRSCREACVSRCRVAGGPSRRPHLPRLRTNGGTRTTTPEDRATCPQTRQYQMLRRLAVHPTPSIKSEGAFP